MKKTYMAPRVEDMGMEANEMISTSLGIAGNSSSAGSTNADSRIMDVFDEFEQAFSDAE